MSTLFSRLKDGFTLIKKQDSIIDLGLAKNELEVVVGFHVTQGWKVDQKYLGSTTATSNAIKL